MSPQKRVSRDSIVRDIVRTEKELRIVTGLDAGAQARLEEKLKDLRQKLIDISQPGV
jgi:hypothetical protein